MKNKYDSSVVFLYMTGNEHILPSEFRRKIPYATISTWRKTDYTKYLGHEFRHIFSDAFDNAELRYKYHKIKNGMLSVAKAWLVLSGIIQPVLQMGKNDKELQKKVLKAIEHMKNSIGIERTLKIVGLSRTTYQQWKLENRFHCFDSFTSLCIKRHPHQLQKREVELLKKKLTDPELDHWPIISIAASCFRDKSLTASIASWYKYAKVLGIEKKLVKKDLKKEGLIATKPNEYWHVDTTYYPIVDHQKACITFVMDNFSKMILGFSSSTKLSGTLVKNALKNAFDTAAKHPDQKDITLVADGGRENHNWEVDSYIKDKLKKVVALKHIQFSNSPSEAINKILKGRYFKNREFESMRSLNRRLSWMVEDYNRERPHCRHKYKTPFEAYFNISLDFDPKQRARQSVLNRVKMNKEAKCIQCRCSVVKKPHCQHNTSIK